MAFSANKMEVYINIMAIHGVDGGLDARNNEIIGKNKFRELLLREIRNMSTKKAKSWARNQDWIDSIINHSVHPPAEYPGNKSSWM
jgi:hypothetical protein